MPGMPYVQRIFITGATGYLGRSLSRALVAQRHTVLGLARRDSIARLSAGVLPVAGDALNSGSYRHRLRGVDTFVHLVGTRRPNPFKAQAFEGIDLQSVRVAVEAAVDARVAHFVYVSVAHPAPVMRAYIAARVEAERVIAASGLNASVLRPWYVLGPGHRWPLLLTPLYRLLRTLPSTRASADRLGLLTLEHMVRALCAAIATPAHGVRVWDVPTIKEHADCIQSPARAV